MANKFKHVAILEDDIDDKFLTENILKELDLKMKVSFIDNSEQLYDLLSSNRPDIILMDYNSRPEDGMIILKKLKADNHYKSIPVIILGDINERTYVDQCYRYGANSVIKKPDTIDSTRQKISAFFSYWLEVAE